MQVCQRCGKGSLIGFDSSHKHGGGWAMRAPKSRRVWRPNLQRVKVALNGKIGRYWLCTKCLKIFKKQNISSPRLKEAKSTLPQTTTV